MIWIIYGLIVGVVVIWNTVTLSDIGTHLREIRDELRRR